jgi:hypothetical protein
MFSNRLSCKMFHLDLLWVSEDYSNRDCNAIKCGEKRGKLAQQGAAMTRGIRWDRVPIGPGP